MGSTTETILETMMLAYSTANSMRYFATHNKIINV